MSPKELDSQSAVKIDEWIDIDSEKIKNIDDNLALTKRWLKIGLDDKFLFTDKLGRVWGSGERGFYPYHIQRGTKLYGIRVSTMAAN